MLGTFVQKVVGTLGFLGKNWFRNICKHKVNTISLRRRVLRPTIWRCPVPWCTVWKGTSQDCMDHMRKAHNTPVVVKAGNLARWFPPWTVTRKQWHSMSRPSVSGIVIDTFLFSRIGMPLFHLCRVFDRQGGHPAFRGPYMPRLFDFLQEADAESIRRSHRRRAKEIAASMSKGASTNKESQATTSSSRRMVKRTSAPRIRGREQGTSLIPRGVRGRQ